MRLLLITLMLAASVSAEAQVIGTQFPEMEAESVEGHKKVLPQDIKGKFSFVGLAYSKKSEEELYTWFNPVYTKFIEKSGGGLMAGLGYDVHVCFIPMFTGVKAAATETARKKALKSVDPVLFPHLLFYRGDLKPYKEALDFEHKDIPYFFVVDRDGKIVYATSGAYTEEKMNAVEAAIE
jgi:hypothetical protein